MSGVSGVAAGSTKRGRFITAFTEERIRSRVFKAGACGFLTKPFSYDSLIECLDTALKSKTARVPSTRPNADGLSGIL
jgi:FixJ family two-component response regulator